MAVVLEKIPQETNDTDMNTYILILGFVAFGVFILGHFLPSILH